MTGKLTNFDHSYRGFLRLSVGNFFSTFVPFNGLNQEIQLICHPQNIEILIDALVATERKKCSISYREVSFCFSSLSVCLSAYSLASLFFFITIIFLDFPLFLYKSYSSFFLLLSSIESLRLIPKLIPF